MVLQKSLATAFLSGKVKLHGGNYVEIPSVYDEYSVNAVLEYAECLNRNGMSYSYHKFLLMKFHNSAHSHIA